jgi:tetratricopeptide (TPR) repeat protein
MSGVRYFRAIAAVLALVLFLGAIGAYSLARRRRIEGVKRVSIPEALRDVAVSTTTRLKELPPGSAPGQKLLRTNLVRLDRLSGELVATSTMDRNSAIALSELGDVLLLLRVAARDWEADSDAGYERRASDLALRLHRRALEMFRTLSEAAPEIVAVKRDLAAAYERLDDVYWGIGSDEQSLNACKDAIDVRLALVAAQPNELEAKRDLAASYWKLGMAQSRLFTYDRAIDAYKEGLAVYEDIAKADPDSAATKRGMAIAYQKVADGFVLSRSTDEAIAAYRKGLDWLGNTKKPASSASHGGHDGVDAQSKSRDQGLELLRIDAELKAALAESNPADLEGKRRAAIDFSNYGHYALWSGSFIESIDAFEKAINATEPLVKADPNNAELKRELARYYRMIGDACLQKSDTQKSLAATQKGLDLMELLMKVEPNDVENVSEVLELCHILGDVYLKLGSNDKAADAYRRSIELAERAAGANPTNDFMKQAHSRGLEKLGSAYLKLGFAEKALDEFRKSIEPMNALAKAHPDAEWAQRELASSIEKLGESYADVGFVDKALDAYRKGVSIRESALKAGPSKEEPVQELLRSYARLGGLSERAGQFAHARRWYEKALEADPQSALAHNDLARLLATSSEKSIRDGKRAVQLAQEACKLTGWEEESSLETLAAACAEVGQFDDAVKWQKKAIELLEEQKQVVLQLSRLKLYEARKPYHETRADSPAVRSK